MSAAAARSRPGSHALHPQSSAKKQNTAARPPTQRGARLSAVLCFGAIAIGIFALIGYVLGNAWITSLSADGKPVAVITAVSLILLGAGLLARRSPTPSGVITARRAAFVVIVLASADLSSSAFSQHIQEWQVWAARGGVAVHSYPFTAFLLVALGSALVLITTRRDFAGHVIASAVLLISAVLAYARSVPSLVDPSLHVLPVGVTTLGVILISIAGLLARPRGWVVPLLSRTSTGVMSRVLLLTTFIVPYLASALRDLIAGRRWFPLGVDPAVVVDVVEVFVSVAVVVGVGGLVHRYERDRLRLASIIDSSVDAIVGASTGCVIESWNAGAEQMYGYTAAEAIGRSATMLAPPERRDEAPALVEGLWRGERIDPFETVRVAKDGRRIDVWLSASPILDDDGNVAGTSTIAHDITSRRKADKAMAESEARYRTLVENLPQKIMLKDRDSVYVSVNEAYARDLGIDPNTVAGKTDYDFFPGDLAEKYRADDARIMDAGVTEELDEEYLEEGQRRPIHTVKTPVRDGQGNVTHILVILWDITEKKLAEERLTNAMTELKRFNRDLARSEAALKEAQRVAKIGHWETSLVTGATTWSDEHYRILGLPIGSATPSHELLLSMLEPKDRRLEEEAFARSLTSAGDARETAVDLHITRPAGDALVVAQRVFVDRDAAGTVVGFHGTLQDVTRRVAIEAALRDSESALAEAQQIARVGSWILDPESGEGHGSAEAFRIFGIDPAPVVRLQLVFDLVHEDDRDFVKAAVAAAVLSGTLDVEARLVTGQRTRVVHALARRRDNDEAHPIMIGTIQDVTEQREAEKALQQQSESLERSNADLERFNRAAVGRELRMIELKKLVNDLCAQLGQPSRFAPPDEMEGEPS